MKTNCSGALLCAFLFAQSIPAFAQGSLTPPPGAPAATMKTLQQVEPRTDLQAPTLPPGVTTDASYHFIINQAGSYYLSANLDVTKANGIDVRAPGVTIDLNGFEIRRSSGAGGNGIEIDSTSHRVVIKNGGLTGFAYGVRCLLGTGSPNGGSFESLQASNCATAGLSAGFSWRILRCAGQNNGGEGIVAADGSVFTDCTAYGNSGQGIVAGVGSILTNCSAHKNSSLGINASSGSTLTKCVAYDNQGTAIFAGNGCTLTDCTAENNAGGIVGSSGSTLTNCSAYGNTATFGIDVASGSTLKNCSARNNTSSGTTSGGIDAGTGSTLIGCSASTSANTNATASPSTGVGIRVGSGATVRDCTVDGNKGDGILVTGDRNQIVGNTCSNNNTGGAGAGIHLTSASNGCRIDSNHCGGGVTSFLVEGTDNFIVRNTAQGASMVIVYDIANDNDVAALVAFPGDGFVSSSPWVNFLY